MHPRRSFGGRCKEWRLQALRLLQAGGECKIADASRAAIILPCRSRQIATHHTLDREWVSLLYQHAATGQEVMIRLAGLWIVSRVSAQQMIANEPLGVRKPKARELGENLPFPWNAGW